MIRCRRPVRSRRPRAGTAIVAALGLMTLGAALLASAAHIAFSSTRATRTSLAALQAESIARRTIHAAVAAWDPRYDSLEVGHTISARVAAEPPVGIASASSAADLHVQRLSEFVYAVSVDGQAGTIPLRARRRLRLIVQRADSASMHGRVAPLARWSSADLY